MELGTGCEQVTIDNDLSEKRLRVVLQMGF